MHKIFHSSEVAGRWDACPPGKFASTYTPGIGLEISSGSVSKHIASLDRLALVNYSELAFVAGIPFR